MNENIKELKDFIVNIAKRYYYRDQRKVFITNIIGIILMSIMIFWMYGITHDCSEFMLLQCPCVEKINGSWYYKDGSDMNLSIFNNSDIPFSIKDLQNNITDT